jgi:hypothetical protein
MKEQIPSTLRQLWNLAGAAASDAKPDWNGTFEPIGLILFIPPRNGGYWCTPVNSLAFATTGGDGVHYSLLAIDDEFSDFSPVVMTVPMCDTPNLIVGASLRDFLALGSRCGYFRLEQLIYHPDRTLEELSAKSFDAETGTVERALLNTISSHFNVTPWLDPRNRLQELATQYGAFIVHPPRDEIDF